MNIGRVWYRVASGYDTDLDFPVLWWLKASPYKEVKSVSFELRNAEFHPYLNGHLQSAPQLLMHLLLSSI